MTPANPVWSTLIRYFFCCPCIRCERTEFQKWVSDTTKQLFEPKDAEKGRVCTTDMVSVHCITERLMGGKYRLSFLPSMAWAFGKRRKWRIECSSDGHESYRVRNILKREHKQNWGCSLTAYTYTRWNTSSTPRISAISPSCSGTCSVERLFKCQSWV